MVGRHLLRKLVPPYARPTPQKSSADAILAAGCAWYVV